MGSPIVISNLPPPPLKQNLILSTANLQVGGEWYKWFEQLWQRVGGGGGNSGVSSFNGRDGDVVLASVDVTDALGYFPANIDSPIFTGIPQGATAPTGTDSQQLATTAFVINELSHGSGAVNQGWATDNTSSIIASPEGGFFLNTQIAMKDIMIPVGANSITLGGISGFTINSGVTVTVSSGCTWLIL